MTERERLAAEREAKKKQIQNLQRQLRELDRAMARVKASIDRSAEARARLAPLAPAPARPRGKAVIGVVRGVTRGVHGVRA